MKKILLAITLITIVLSSCKKDNNSGTPAYLGYNYFPVNVGHEAIYDASLITKDEFTLVQDTSYFQVKEYIESVFLDNQGRVTQRLERYKRDTPNDPWVISDVWTSNITNIRAEKKEDNITYVKLVFPVNLGVTWNGNVLNTLDEIDYNYTSVHQPEVIGGQPFDSVTTVVQQNEYDFLGTDYFVEKYAAGVGLVYRENTHIDNDYATVPPGIKGQRLYKETIVSWIN